MEEERIDILSDDFKVIRSCLKSEAHQNGWLHASVHIWFYTQDGSILLQKRAADKVSFPNLWDVSVAGHISAGESGRTAAVREIEEEIGLSVEEKDLLKIGNFKEYFQHDTDFFDHEYHHIYLAVLNREIESLHIQKEELSDIKLMSVAAFKKILKDPDFDKSVVPHQGDYYDFILTEIEKRLA